MGSPPRAGSKNGQSSSRSISNRISPAISGGNANRIMAATTSRYQAYSGMRLMRMPGGRHLRMPMIISTAAAIDATSINDSPSIQMSAPMPDCSTSVVSGGYMNQPPLGAAAKKIEPQTNTPPSRKLQ